MRSTSVRRVCLVCGTTNDDKVCDRCGSRAMRLVAVHRSDSEKLTAPVRSYLDRGAGAGQPRRQSPGR
jgi:hypothetical protein